MGADYLAVYDYGMGGVWVVVSADSADAVTDKYPELEVFEERPAWLNDEQYAQLERHNIDESPTGFLRVLIDGRPNA
jgi:hypothetical protein